MSKSPRLSRRTFQEWKGHPATEEFCQYLRDQVDRLTLEWAGSEGEMHPWARPKAFLFRELADLKWSDVRDFYGIEETDADE